jgi:ABC-type nitrate/sulfonate/bicarbonate transport system substrate-binding protein
MPDWAPATLRLVVGSFGGASAFPARVAEAIGAFDRAGLAVEHRVTAGSGHLADGLADGSLDVVHAAPDNVIAWRDERGLPVVAWLAGSSGPISLVARGARATADLRGATIGVDAPGSGFAPILRGLLSRAGIDEADVTLVALGATRARYAALVAGSIDATMLTLPWTRLAVARGAAVVGEHVHVAPRLLTSCGASLEGWLDDRPAVARAYAAALDAALAWLRDPDASARGTALLSDDLGVDADTARDVLTALRDPVAGWPPTTSLAPDALDATWRLRATVQGRPAERAEAYIRRPS